MKAAPGSVLSEYMMTSTEQGQLEGEEGASGDAEKKTDYISSADRKRERLARIFMWAFIFGVVGSGLYLGRPLEKEEREKIGWGEVCQFFDITE